MAFDALRILQAYAAFFWGRPGQAHTKHQYCSNIDAREMIQEPRPIDALIVTSWVLIAKWKLTESFSK